MKLIVIPTVKYATAIPKLLQSTKSQGSLPFPLTFDKEVISPPLTTTYGGLMKLMNNVR